MKYQPTHGLCFKNVPFDFSRTDCYQAILNLKNEFEKIDGGKVEFPGGLGMMQFMFPKLKKGGNQRNQTAFPIFKSRDDRNMLWRCAVQNAVHNQNAAQTEKTTSICDDRKGLLYLPHPKSGEHHLVNVELVRNVIGEPMHDVVENGVDKSQFSEKLDRNSRGSRNPSLNSSVNSFSNNFESFGPVGNEQIQLKIGIPDIQDTSYVQNSFFTPNCSPNIDANCHQNFNSNQGSSRCGAHTPQWAHNWGHEKAEIFVFEKV